ncbi:Ubiquinone/menaquinone biosynthesis C-methylase UbiE [Streptomyces zhaozhouensis]|uniref:Ubiquinone/menaquinone biosynthesis C-methylase UbiE n=1 Tax=Streptomyces zhaozhouensis TaxID=1300267 RepID=A0A286DXV0_9ACTN|nr:methyltransferase domain-containing protein [Streptomyces zhaozhouensis]SOD63374.1 Ubiquinone/menaquinone biosynthesis C-methylase UbiE [Streptomyces zhaozhouensis]
MASTHAPGYAFPQDPERVGHQMRWVAAACDGMSLPRLAATGVARGWRCLEIGTGGGSLARWLAERVAPEGEVIATDLRPPAEPPPPGLRYLTHDVVHDPLPEGGFDLIVSRLVLQHLPEREKVLARLAGALVPGGWLQIDEYDISSEAPLLLPDPEAERLYRRFLTAKGEALRAAGADPCWGREVAAAMRAVGLVEIDPRPHVELRTPETASLRLQVHHTYHLRDRLVAAGMTEAEVTAVRELMCDPSFRACSSLFYSVQGRRAEG